MWRKQLGILGTLVVATVLGGCVPATYVQVPALQGRVVGPDGGPVATAVVHVVRDSDHAEVATIPAAADGTFHRPERSSFMVQFAGADSTLTSYSVSATAGGRRSPTTQVTDGVRRWFFGYYDPPCDCDLGILPVR